MGPRSRERGDEVQGADATGFPELQWGRAHVSAEIAPRRGGCKPDREASMGPRSRERGDRI